MTELKLENVCVTRDNRAVLNTVTTRFNSGELVALLGANGAGKSTLVRAALGLLGINSGTATIDAVDASTLSEQDRALKVAYLPQARELSWPISVLDTVALGRFAHGVRLDRLADHDRLAINAAVTACDLEALTNRRVDQLSGGELARVHCARAFATEAPMLIADEPVAELDPRHQFQLMQMIREYVDRGRGAVVIMHDPELAARFADRLVWMIDGSVVCDGSVSSTLTNAQLETVYGMKADVQWSGKNAKVTMLEPV